MASGWRGIPGAKPPKYRAKRTTVQGIEFASRAEAAEYQRLTWQQIAGEIKELEVQPVYLLHAPNGEVLGKYIGDFRYRDSAGVHVVDVKGMKTLPLSKWKQKHVRAEYGITVEERRKGSV